jgi:hypothetical protein
MAGVRLQRRRHGVHHAPHVGAREAHLLPRHLVERAPKPVGVLRGMGVARPRRRPLRPRPVEEAEEVIAPPRGGVALRRLEQELSLPRPDEG